MKFPRIMALAAMAAMLFSCQELPEEDTNKDFSISRTSIEIPYTGGEVSIEIKSPAAWSIDNSYVTWCTVSPSSGAAGTTNVKVTVQPNPNKESDRSGKLLVKYDDIVINVTVSQEINTEDPVFSISNKSFDIEAEGGEFEFTVISDAADYDITVVDSWIKKLSTEGDRYTGKTHRFSALLNETPSARTGVVSVCTKNGTCIPVTVNQAAGNAPLYVHSNVGYRFTATWCGWCPYMDEAFHLAAQEASYNFNYITFHASSGYPMYLAASATLANYYNVSGYPTGILNGWKEINNSTDTSANAVFIGESIDKFESIFPCIAGISVSSAITDGKLEIDASVKAIPGQYRITALVLESGIVKAQAYYTENSSTTLNDFTHDNVARKVLTSSVKGEAFSVTEEPSTFTWSTDISSFWNADNLSVAVVVSRSYEYYKDYKDNKGYPDNYVVNSVIVPAGSSKEMEYAQ